MNDSIDSRPIPDSPLPLQHIFKQQISHISFTPTTTNAIQHLNNNAKNTNSSVILYSSNSVLCYSGKLPSSVKLKLLYAYRSSLYGCELWDLWNKNIDTACVAWRKALRRVWNLHIVIFCLNCLMLSLYSMLYANERYLLLLSVFIVTVTLLHCCSICNSSWSHDFTTTAQRFVIWFVI